MNNLEKEFVSDDGSTEKMVATSNDNEVVRMTSNGFTLANHKNKKESKIVKKFKGSILGTEVGFKSGGFSSIAGLAIVLVLAALAVMYFIWRF